MSDHVDWLDSPYIDERIVSEGSDVQALLTRIDSDRIRAASCVVIRVTWEVLVEYFAVGVDAAQNAQALHSRLPTKKLLLLALKNDGSTHQICEVTISGLVWVTTDSIVESLRANDLNSLCADNLQHADLRLMKNQHFITPAGVHARRFVRVADLVKSRDDIERIAYWLAPRVAAASAILVDNASILAIVLRAAAYSVASKHIDFFPSHAANNAGAAAAIVERAVTSIESTGNKPPNVLCVMSLSSTGSFTGLLEKLFEKLGKQDQFRSLSLLKFRDATCRSATLCEIPIDAEIVGSSVETCSLCKDGDTAVKVDPEVYHLRSPKESPIRLKRSDFAGTTFCVDYRESKGVFFIHRDDPHDDRHHAFYIDVNGLLESPAFIEKLYAKLSEYPNVDVICSPPHPCARRIGALAATRLGKPHLASESFHLKDLDPEQQELLKRAKGILVVDDLFLSGSQLDRINKGIRHSAATLGSFEHVHFLVMVARPARHSIWDAKKESMASPVYKWKTSLTSIEYLLLPDARSVADRQVMHCPWCSEFDRLTDRSRRQAEPEGWLLSRLGRLTDRRNGLSDEVLFRLAGVDLPVLGDGSVIAPANTSEIVTLFAVASAVQGLRNSGATPLGRVGRSGHPMSSESFDRGKNILDAGTINRYSEGLIRACLIRVLELEEWGDANFRLAIESLRAAASEPDQAIVLGEALLLGAKAACSVVTKTVLQTNPISSHCAEAVAQLFGLEH